jgi:GDP-4-dehydro-6-deoxy-D-mannose reductase
MKKVLITGASGFVGSHLAEYLETLHEYEVFGTVFGDSSEAVPGLLSDHMVRLNLLDRDKTIEAVNTVQPDMIFHLAALSSPSASFKDPRGTLTNNIEGQINVLDGARALPQKPRVLIIGTAEEYGKVSAADIPITEEAPLNPVSPYAVSKIAQDYLGVMYEHAYGLPIVRVRPFNHIGERQTDQFVVPAFAKQIALIESQQQDNVLQVGELTAVRDFTDVKDMVRAYHCLPWRWVIVVLCIIWAAERA